MSSSYRQPFVVTVKHNDLASVPQALQVLVERAAAILTEPDVERLRFALQELLLNAVEHGNLRISNQEKREALKRNRYERLLEARRRDPHLRRRRVAVKMIQTTDMVEYRIGDDGEGFDWRQFTGEKPADVSASTSGRGIFLVKASVGNLTYNERGNEAVIMMPLRARPEASKTVTNVDRTRSLS